MSQSNRRTSDGRRVLTAEQKRRILHKRKMRRLKRRLMVILPIALVLIAVPVILLTVGGRDSATQKDTVSAMSVSGEGMVEVTPMATAVATPVPTQAPFDFDRAYVSAVKGEVTGPDVVYDYSDINQAMLGVWPEAKNGYIPILRRGNTSENIICVTVDDCYQPSNFRRIVECAIQNNAKLTIFPIGDNITKQGVGETLKLAYENGMEIGNHTYQHTAMFHYGQERMINEIWYQRQEVNRALGFEYSQNFFRPRGGDERECQRMHAYLNQLGYKGVAMWNKSGSSDPMDDLYAELAPGNIYLFHTTDNDLEKLLDFIPGAIARGYRLVTMSEMFGLEMPAVSAYNPVYTPVAPEGFRVIPHDMKLDTYTRSVATVQQRLIDLGWMSGEATGVYGQQTVMGIAFFQMAIGQEPDGNANVELQKIIFSDSAPRGSLEQVQEYCRQLGKPVLNILPGTLNDA